MNASRIPPADVRTLFRPFWRGEEAALRVLLSPPLRAALHSEVRFGALSPMLRRSEPDPAETLHAGVLATLDAAVRHEGLTAPEGFWGRADARPFLVKVFRDRLVDRHRRAARQRYVHDDAAIEAVVSPPSRGRGEAERHARYAAWLAANGPGALRLSHALALGASRDLLLVEAVAEQLAEGLRTDVAFLRPADETARLLEGWLDRVPTAPAPCRARRELAWILRDTGRDGPSEWQRRELGAASRALDLLLKWERRAEASLPAHLLAEIGPVVVLERSIRPCSHTTTAARGGGQRRGATPRSRAQRRRPTGGGGARGSIRRGPAGTGRRGARAA